MTKGVKVLIRWAIQVDWFRCTLKTMPKCVKSPHIKTKLDLMSILNSIKRHRANNLDASSKNGKFRYSRPVDKHHNWGMSIAKQEQPGSSHYERIIFILKKQYKRNYNKSCKQWAIQVNLFCCTVMPKMSKVLRWKWSSI